MGRVKNNYKQERHSLAVPAAPEWRCIRPENKMEKIRYFFRLGYDLGLYDSLRYKDFAERINEIGRMCGGWLKSLEK